MTPDELRCAGDVIQTMGAVALIGYMLYLFITRK